MPTIEDKRYGHFDVQRQYSQMKKGILSANLMCTLLESITYRRLYEERLTADLINDLIERAKVIGDDLNIEANGRIKVKKPTPANNRGQKPDKQIKDAFYRSQPGQDRGAFPELRRAINDHDDIEIKIGELFKRQLWSQNPPEGEPEAYTDVVNILDDVRSHDRQDYSHFCVPFVDLQKAGLTEAQWADVAQKYDRFIAEYGDRDITHFFTSVAMDANEKARIAEYKEYGILSPSRRYLSKSNVTSGNGMRCNAQGVCEESNNPDDFCTMVDDGNGGLRCSLYSD